MRCFDTAKVYTSGGPGGNGCVSFRREKFVPKGGPSGGNGGHGGDVVAVADEELASLLPFRRRVHFRGKKGTPGGGKGMHGRDGSDTVVRVPLGTLVREAETGELMGELLQPGDRLLLASGGRGGRGNVSFKSQNRRAPVNAELGEEGEERWVTLELKVVADVGIVGVPNAGKSTLLSVLSNARPKVADYPFTTLVPNLGVCERGYETTVFADVPGLIEGASAGVGLGFEFLRHCERCRVLVHVLDCTSPDPVGDYDAIRVELESFGTRLGAKPELVVLNKMDLPHAAARVPEVREALESRGVGAMQISAATGEGTDEMLAAARAMLAEAPADEEPDEDDELLYGELGGLPEIVSKRKRKRRADAALLTDFSVERAEDGTWVVEGDAIVRFVQMTNWEYYEALQRFQAVLKQSGLQAALKEAGCENGHTVSIGGYEFEWADSEDQAKMYDEWLKARMAQGGLRGSHAWPSPV